MSNQIKKAMSQEELSVLSNIESLIGELKMMQGEEILPGEEIVEEMEEMEEVDKQEEENMDETKKQEEEDEDVEKTIDTTPSDVATADSDAEERIEDAVPEQTEENVDEVAKNIARLLLGIPKKKPVKKSTNVLMTDAIGEIVRVQKDNQNEVSEVKKALTNLIEGLGIADQFKVAKKSQSKNKPIVDNDNNEMLNFIKKELGLTKGHKEDQFNSQSDSVNKNLANADVLSALTGAKFK